jgi:hypothetical protein
MVFGSVRHIQSNVGGGTSAALVVETRLTDSEKARAECSHHQGILINATRVLLNCVHDPMFKEILDPYGRPAWTFEWDTNGYLQPQSLFNGRSKLENSFGEPKLASILNAELLTAKSQPSFLDATLRRLRDNLMYKFIIENLKEGNWVIQPEEMHLNLKSTHPMLDSFSFSNSKSFVIQRKICIKHIVSMPDLFGH